jgi:outer membrane protein W
MDALKRSAISVVLVLLLISLSYAQSLEKRHQIGLRLGMWSQVTSVRTEISTEGVSTSVGGSGFLGELMYGNWLQEDLALDISIGSMATDVETQSGVSGVSSETDVIGRIHLGLKYYPFRSTLNSSTRPFVGAGVGPVIGTQTKQEVGRVVVTESRTEAAIGGQIGVGVDFVLGRHFMIGLAAYYNLMTDFKEPIGGSENYSGPEFCIGFGYLFGKGIE